MYIEGIASVYLRRNGIVIVVKKSQKVADLNKREIMKMKGRRLYFTFEALILTKVIRDLILLIMLYGTRKKTKYHKNNFEFDYLFFQVFILVSLNDFSLENCL